jgi:hypothetical protein
MQKQLDIPSPYYEGFYTNIKGKIINFYYFCNNQKVKKIIFKLFFVFDSQNKEKKDHIYIRQLYFLIEKCMDQKKGKLKNKKLKVHTETFFFVLSHWRDIFLLFCILQKLNIYICKVYKRKV